jgi:putative tryptophan/tyrosine transport system substrate-binding protein
LGILKMRRREFITLLGGAVAPWPLAARAQQRGKVWRIGFLAGGSRPVSSDFHPYAGFLRGMRELGYVEGKEFIVEWRFAEGRFQIFPDLAAELVSLNVDVIVLGTPTAVPAAQHATRTIPIVMGISVDPVGMGYVVSLARPGGNITGLAGSLEGVVPKGLQLLMMAVPGVTRIGFLMNPDNPAHVQLLAIGQTAAQTANLTLMPAEARHSDEVASAFATLSKEHAGAAMVPGDAFFFSHRQRIAEIALKTRLPTIFAQREYVEAGGLMSYGESLADFYRRAAFYVDRILKGEKPANLPIQQPARFFFVINRKTAEALGLAIQVRQAKLVRSSRWKSGPSKE